MGDTRGCGGKWCVTWENGEGDKPLSKEETLKGSERTKNNGSDGGPTRLRTRNPDGFGLKRTSFTEERNLKMPNTGRNVSPIRNGG